MHAIPDSVIPPRRGLEKEEPELADEDDIPSDEEPSVEDGQVDHGALFHTYLQAAGVDSTGSFDIDGRDMPIADPSTAAVSQLLT